MADAKVSAFPSTGIMPKVETQALEFVRKNPTWDGRGTIVAILDTGCDPGAIGLQTTSDGKTKVIDIVDTTGSGDLDTDKEVEGKTDADCVNIVGASGKSLKLSKDWKNPTGKWYVGIKPEFDLYPKTLIRRIKKEQKSKFLEAQRKRKFDLSCTLTQLEAKSDKKEELEEIKAQIDALSALEQSYDPPGRVFDVVTFHDGKNWRAVVDTKCDGDLTKAKPMADYRIEHQYETFSALDLMNYSVNIYNEGKVVSIVVTAGSHGTHVAGIVAAHFPDDPTMNGIAPGAQIVSVKIGDTRLGSMETNTGMCRAINAILRNKCDLVNMSYGEPTSTPNKGRFPELCSELVNKYNVIFVSSAGNAGPALTTVGAPGSTTKELIGVGAYVSPDMMKSEYAMRTESKGLAEIQYTWSSRGPTANGHLGVCISAPGGAIAPIPQWTLERNTLMNGTSMASPNACGGLSLVLSALKESGISYNPHSVRRAVENSARYVENIERFAQGYGLLQVKNCFEYIKKNVKSAESSFNYLVSVVSGSGCAPTHSGPAKACGVYLREPQEVKKIVEVSASVVPKFHEDTKKTILQEFQQKILIRSSAYWVETPDCMVMNSGGRGFSFSVDPTQLTSGSHYTEVCGMDSTNLSKGPLFRIPITVIIPDVKQDKLGLSYKYQKVAFSPGKLDRKYFAIPSGATWAHIQLKPASKIDTVRKFMVASLWLSGQEGYRDHEINEFVAVRNDSVVNYNISVSANHTLELVVAQYWSSLGVCEMDVSINFYGVQVSPSSIILPVGCPGVSRVDVTSTTHRLLIEPKASFTHRHSQYRPLKATVKPLIDAVRDVLPGNRCVSQLLLEYSFQLTSKFSTKVTFPFLNSRLYDSPFGSQLYMIFDENKRTVASGDAWPDATTLQKGKYTVHLHVRHDDTKLLDSLKSMVMVLVTKLSKPVSVSAHPSYCSSVANAPKFGTKAATVGEVVPVFFKAPKSTPAGVNPGDILVGKAEFSKSKLGSEDKNSIPVTAVVPPQAKKASAAAAKPVSKSTGKKDEAKEEKKEESALATSIRKATIACFDKLKGEELKECMKSTEFKDLEKQYGGHRDFLQLQLRIAEKLKQYPQVVEAADKVIKTIDTAELAKYFGKNPSEEEKKKLQKSKTEEKAILTATLLSKINAFKEQIESSSKGDVKGLAGATTELKSGFEDTFKQYKQWIDEKKQAKKLTPLTRFACLIKGEYGKALKSVLETLTSAPTKELLKLSSDISSALGWQDWAAYSETWTQIKCPKTYRSF